MLKKILALAMALTMVAGMAVSSSAAKVVKKKTTDSSQTISATAKPKDAAPAKSTALAYDFCQTQLSDLSEKLHDAFVKGLQAKQDTIKADITGYTDSQVGEAFQKALQIIIEQHAEIFWLDTSMQNFASNGKILYFYPRPSASYGTADVDGTSPSKLDMAAIGSTEAKLQSFGDKITGKTPYELTKNIHDAIIANSEYYAGNSDKPSYHEATGALIYGVGMCDSYAKSFKYLADYKGLTALVVGGKASNDLGQTGTHAWNYVKLDDGKWYPIDTGWDDPVVDSGKTDNSKYNYVYFLKNVENDKRIKDGYKYPTISSTAYKAA